MTDGLSTRIRRAREDAGLTREEMAPQLGVTLRTLGRYETGETQQISTAMLVKISAATRKPLGFFLNGEPAEDAA